MHLRLQLVVDAGEEDAVLVMLDEKIAHSFEGGAGSNKVIEDNAIRLFGEVVH